MYTFQCSERAKTALNIAAGLSSHATDGQDVHWESSVIFGGSGGKFWSREGSWGAFGCLGLERAAAKFLSGVSPFQEVAALRAHNSKD